MLTPTGADSGKVYTARDSIFPIVCAALSCASVVTWAYYDVCNGDIGVLHIRGENPRRIAILAVRGTLKTWQIDRVQGEYGLRNDDPPPPQLALAYALTVHKSQEGAAALSRHRHRRHGSEHPPPAAGKGVQRKCSAGVPWTELPAGRVPMAGGKEPSERR